jgi:hypothetical protein
VEKRGRKNPEVDAARMVALDAIKKNVKVERAERIGRPEVVRRAAMDGAETGKPVDAAFVKPRPEGPTDISRWRKPPDSLHQCYPPWRAEDHALTSSAPPGRNASRTKSGGSRHRLISIGPPGRTTNLTGSFGPTAARCCCK